MSEKRGKERMRTAPQMKYLPLKKCIAELKCFPVSSQCFFLMWHRGTCFPLCRPIYAISEREVITQGYGGMFFILSALPASLLEIRLLSGQLKDAACWGRPVWHRQKRGMPQREQWGFDPYLSTISVIKPWTCPENISWLCRTFSLWSSYLRFCPFLQTEQNSK